MSNSRAIVHDSNVHLLYRAEGYAKRAEDRLKCGRFYVDTAAKPTGKYTYAISTVDLSNNEGPQCPAVSTDKAK